MQSTTQASAFEQLQLKYLQRLAEQYPTIDKAAVEIINLQAILNLPKGTEHFITDIHGAYEAFSHVLKTGSGSVKKKTRRQKIIGNADLLSARKNGYCQKDRTAYAGLVQNRSLSADYALQNAVLKVYPCKSTGSHAAGLCLCNGRVDY